jgi:hypothetical protein
MRGTLSHVASKQRNDKTMFIRTRVQEERLDRYEQAFSAWAKESEADMTLSDWVRRACDRQAEEDLGL